MGNLCNRSNSKNSTEPNIRRIYVGNVPMLNDETDIAVGKTGRLERTSNQSINDPEINAETVVLPPVPVRRQSIIGSMSNDKPKPRRTFPDNTVTSSRYTAVNFFPKNLFEQFRRVVNAYFLIVAIVQTVADSPVSPITAVAPLAFVIVVTMIKQGYEDWQRHKADNFFNNRPATIIREGVAVQVKSKDIKVGDIVKLEGDEQVPTDVLLIGTSDEFCRCQLNTANLDGETNLKMRYCPSGLPHFRDDSEMVHLNVIVECEEPCEDLYRFNGNLLISHEVLALRGDSSTGLGHHVESKTVEAAEGKADKIPDSEIPATVESRVGPKITFDIPSTDPTLLPETEEPPELGPIPSLGSNLGVGTTVSYSHFLQICLGMENLVLRGTRIKNTDFVYGIVLYTGIDTRLAQNSNKNSGPKFSTIEKSVNKYLGVFIIILACLVIAASLISIFVQWFPDPFPWYLQTKSETPGTLDNFKYYFDIAASFLILFNYIIPISLYVTMEMQKFVGGKFFVWDEEMTSETGDPPLCNTSDLNEELGQIEYLFSDKTGTLTENIMAFKHCSVNGVRYDYIKKLLHRPDSDDNSKRELVPVNTSPELQKFLRSISICHTVQVMPARRPSVDYNSGSFEFLKKKKKKKVSTKVKTANSLFTIGKEASLPSVAGFSGYEYHASSPDEKALLESSAALGVVFFGEKEEELSLEICEMTEKVKRHMVLEFDPDRKCMSVIIENSAGEFWVYTKGAESTIIPKCDSGALVETMKHVSDFACAGMRTLVIAERKISKAEFESFVAQLKAARRLLKDRDITVRRIYGEIESHLNCIGATAVEDKLQENVSETVQALAAAGIKIWILTGDKVETAINVGISSGLIQPFCKQFIITNYFDQDKEEVIRRFTEVQNDMIPGENNALIMDGETIEAALQHCREVATEVAMRAHSVVCARMAPLQKALVVKMVKNRQKITAAVGDGANDVAMIQEAHIGIGILGKEGRQAARCADFALAKFGFLKRAILVHGHWYYVRLANLANYFFYKNIVFIMPQVFYCFHSSFSTQALFDGIFLMMYNIFYTACPILFYGLMEQSIPAEVLLKDPWYYTTISKNKLMSSKVFIKWFVFALWHAFVAFYFALFSWKSFHPIGDLSSFGTVVFCGIVAVTNMKIAIETKYVTWWYVGSQIYSYVTFFVFTAIYSEVDLRFIFIDPKEFRHVYFEVMGVLVFWLLMILVTITAIIPDILWKSIFGGVGNENSHKNKSLRRIVGIFSKDVLGNRRYSKSRQSLRPKPKPSSTLTPLPELELSKNELEPIPDPVA